jgi:hypothetical protein
MRSREGVDIVKAGKGKEEEINCGPSSFHQHLPSISSTHLKKAEEPFWLGR